MNKPSGNKQGQLDSHLQPTPIKEKTIPYSNKLFSEAAIWWLMNTHQVMYGVVVFMTVQTF